MSNLVPEPRQDKNGKIVIRHVKVDGSGNIGSLPIPAPQAVVQTPQRNPMTEVLCDGLSYSIMESTVDFDSLMDDLEGENDDRRSDIYDHLMSMPDELVHTIHGLQEDDEKLFHVVAGLVGQMESPKFISNMIGFRETVNTDGDAKQALVRSLDYYPQLAEYDDLRMESPEIISKARSLILVAHAISENADDDEYAEKFIDRHAHDTDFISAPVIRHESLIDLALTNHERASDIAMVIRKRKVYHADEIRNVLDHPEVALSDGVL